MKRYLSLALVSLGLGCGAAPSSTPGPAAIEARSAAATDGCGPWVALGPAVIDVAPSGADDTAALQCALDAAIARGRPAVVRLAPGTFHTAQLVARGFTGAVRGAGEDATIVTNVDRPVAVAEHFGLDAPSAANPWPSLLAFVDGSFRVADLALVIRGEAPTAGWAITGYGTIHAFAHAAVVLGTRAEATFERVRVEGAAAPDDLFGVNLVNGVFFEGFVGEDPAPLSGSLDVLGCTFRTLGSGAPVVNLRDARVHVSGSVFEDVLLGGEIADVERSSVTWTGNTIDAAWIGIDAYDLPLGPSAVLGTSDAAVRITGNAIRAGAIGVEVVSTFGERVSWVVAGNDLDAPVDVSLGEGTRGCVVATDGVVEDLGAGNRVVPGGR